MSRSTCETRRLGCRSRIEPLRNGPAEISHPVEDVARRESLGALGAWASGFHSTSERRIVPTDGALGPGLMVLADLNPPTSAPHSLDVLQVTIPIYEHRVARDLRRTSRRDHRAGSTVVNGLVHSTPVVRTICGDDVDCGVDLVQQVGHDGGVGHVLVRELHRDDDPILIHCQVELLPASPSSPAPLGGCPLSLAEHAHASRIDHQVQTPLDKPGFSNYFLQEKLPDGTWRTYYHGRFGPNETMATVRSRHAGNVGADGTPRFRPGVDRMRRTPGTRIYAEARRLEHERCVRDGTHIGQGRSVRGNVGTWTTP